MEACLQRLDTYRRAGKRMPYNNNTDTDINYLTLKNGKPITLTIDEDMSI